MTTYQKERPETIQSMFGTIAKQYDKTNAILSLQMHKKWNQKLIDLVMENQQPKRILDLCCGTGEIALTYLKNSETPCEAFLLDFCHEMLACAKVKSEDEAFQNHQIHFLEADAQKIPLPSDSIQCATVAYGIRNVQDPVVCAKDTYRVLAPGGRFGILELTQPKNSVLKLGHKFYLKTILPTVGKWIASNKDAYKYLCNSIKSFVPPEQLEKILIDAGFENTKRHSLLGGVATIITGDKPKN